MKKTNVLYEENGILAAKYHHPKSNDYLEYISNIKIKNSGKNPIEIILKFDGIPPFVDVMPPKNHTLRAPSILELQLKIVRWLKKYGYVLA